MRFPTRRPALAPPLALLLALAAPRPLPAARRGGGEYSGRKPEVNQVAFSRPGGKGRGTFLREPLST